jgi:hypothetical protein
MSGVADGGLCFLLEVDEPNSAPVLDWLVFAVKPDTSTQPFVATVI